MSADEAALAELLSRVAQGDHAAFDALYRETWPRVLSAVRRKLVDRAQSEEVAQEVFLEVWQQAARFSPARGRAVGWMVTMASRRAIDRVRAAQAARDRDRWVAEHSYEVAHDHVLEHAIASSERDVLCAALERLRPLQREALTVTYLNGYSVAEAAAAVGASESAVKTRMRNGILELREALDESKFAA